MKRARLSERKSNGLHLLGDEDALADGVLVAFLDRNGGVSSPPYDSLNLAVRVGDERVAVEENRRRAMRAVGAEGWGLALARQVHGCDVVEVPAGANGVIGEGDVLVVRSPGVVGGLLTADCAPVVIAGEDGVAVAHAGWRGLVADVIAAAGSALRSPVRAWVGPCIHACCYEVGPEVVAAFEGAGLPVAAADRVDPGRAAQVALRRLGIDDIAASAECTSCNGAYFSYRRDGITGRQGTLVAVMETKENGPA